MKPNQVTIVKKGAKTFVYLNGIKLDRVLDVSYRKSSALEDTEVRIVLHVSELKEAVME